jgi:preprotein translocase subunit YajC
MLALLLHTPAGLTGAVLAATKAKTSSNPTFLIIIVVLLGVYLLWLRPQRKRQQAAAMSQRQAEVGDEVVTAAGIYGKVLAFDGDRASVEIAPGTTIEIARRALGQRVDPITVDEEPDEGGTGFGHPGYDGHDDLDDAHDHNGPAANGAGEHIGGTAPAAEGDEPAAGGSS